MERKNYEIIDFHTHPFIHEKNNICAHKSHCDMSADSTLRTFDELGITRFCGSVLSVSSARADYPNPWEQNLAENRIALSLWERYGARYIPASTSTPTTWRNPLRRCTSCTKRACASSASSALTDMTGTTIPLTVFPSFWTRRSDLA